MILQKPLVLVGPMGVGKTTIGKKLSKRLEMPFVDTDQMIVKKHGSIVEIFANLGEERFRELESAELVEALKSPSVVATGGGIVLSRENRDALKKAIVVYLATNGRHIRTRLAAGNRPLLKNGFSDWERIYDERKHLYEAVADFVIDTSSSALADIIKNINENLEKL